MGEQLQAIRSEMANKHAEGNRIFQWLKTLQETGLVPESGPSRNDNAHTHTPSKQSISHTALTFLTIVVHEMWLLIYVLNCLLKSRVRYKLLEKEFYFIYLFSVAETSKVTPLFRQMEAMVV